MKLLKNKFINIYIISIVLLLTVLILSIPISNILNKNKLVDNLFVKDQVIINPEAKSSEILNRKIKIFFKSEVDSSLNWEFGAIENSKILKIGENYVVKYQGKNLSNKSITVTADFIADPENIIPYIIKTECFCFTEQTLAPGESQIFSMVFFLDPSLDSDKDLDKIEKLDFTYKLSEYIS